MARKKHNDTKNPADDTCRRPGCSHVRSKHNGVGGTGIDGRCTGLHYDPFGPAQPCECKEFVEPLPKAKPVKLEERVEITATWAGESPKIGDFLMGSGPATKYGYKVIDIHERKTKDKIAQKVLEIGALRVPVKEVPTGATIHPFKWNPRERNRKRLNTAWGD